MLLFFGSLGAWARSSVARPVSSRERERVPLGAADSFTMRRFEFERVHYVAKRSMSKRGRQRAQVYSAEVTTALGEHRSAAEAEAGC